METGARYPLHWSRSLGHLQAVPAFYRRKLFYRDEVKPLTLEMQIMQEMEGLVVGWLGRFNSPLASKPYGNCPNAHLQTPTSTRRPLNRDGKSSSHYNDIELLNSYLSCDNIQDQVLQSTHADDDL